MAICFACPFVSPPPLRLPFQKNPPHKRQIRNRRPRRLPPPRKIQMVPRQKPHRLLRRPMATPPKFQKKKENLDAPPDYQHPGRSAMRPHKPQRPRQSKGKPPPRHRITKPLQPHQEKNKITLKIQRPRMGQNPKKVQSQNSAK